MKVLVVVDMQNDFVTGALGTPEAQAIVPAVEEKIKSYRDNPEDVVIATRDLHAECTFIDGFMLEGKLIPAHCIRNTPGSKLIPCVDNSANDVIGKHTFGTFAIEDSIYDFVFGPDDSEDNTIESIELCGVCTDICVVSNALILRAAFPDIPIIVDAKCCAGSTPEKHEAALKVMESCLIDVVR